MPCRLVRQRSSVSAAAILAVPLKDTIKELRHGIAARTPDRAQWRAAQTPQVFDADLIKAALTNAINKGLDVTDDCMAVEQLGAMVHITEGSAGNIKITTKQDIAIADAILKTRKFL